MTVIDDVRTTAEGVPTAPRRAPRVSRGQVIGAIPLAMIVLITIFGPLFVPFSATDVVAASNLPPDAKHWMGTDSSGLDVFSRVVVGFRYDVLVALSTTIIATIGGILVGLVIGMLEPRRDVSGASARLLARGIDLFQAIPSIVVALALVAFLGSSVVALAVAIALILGPVQVRLVRTETLKVRGDAYLDAARMAGETEWGLTMRHALPNASWPALENASLIFGSAILVTSTLGFLGVGLQPPTPEWGAMLSTAASDAAVGRWWSALFPALAIIATVSAAAFAGHRLLTRR